MVFIVIVLIIAAMICGDALHRVIVDDMDWTILIIPFITLAIEIFCIFMITHDKKQDAIRDFEAGKYTKEILYKTKIINDQPVVIDSLVNYTKCKETKTYILQ